MGDVLTLQNVSYVYGPDTPFTHTALDKVSLSIEKGSFVGLIGHTGSGKSTLVQHLNGLLRPTGGQVLLEGKDIWAEPEKIRRVRHKVGLVFQYPEYQLFEETVYKDIAYGPKNAGLSDEETDERVKDAMRFVGLREVLFEKSPFELSGGQKRRVAIAGILAMDPEVLVLDEPTAGLDPGGRDEIMENLREYYRSQKKTVVLVTHSMNDIARMAERIIVMNRSQLFMEGSLDEVFSKAEELEQIGLSVPLITRVFLNLAKREVDIGRPIYTVPQGRDAILMKLRGKTDA